MREDIYTHISETADCIDNSSIGRFRSIADKLTSTYVRKNADYGDSYHSLYTEFGPLAGVIPLQNKLDRIKNIVKGHDPSFESLSDSLIDLASYAIMFKMELDKE